MIVGGARTGGDGRLAREGLGTTKVCCAGAAVALGGAEMARLARGWRNARTLGGAMSMTAHARRACRSEDVLGQNMDG